MNFLPSTDMGQPRQLESLCCIISVNILLKTLQNIAVNGRRRLDVTRLYSSYKDSSGYKTNIRSLLSVFELV